MQWKRAQLLLVVAAAALTASSTASSALIFSIPPPSPSRSSSKSQPQRWTGQSLPFGLGKKCGNAWSGFVNREEDDNAAARRCASDILALFGNEAQRNSVEQSRAEKILSSIRLLVPVRQDGTCKSRGDDEKRLQDVWERIWEPPPSVAALAEKAVEWAGEPQALLAEVSSASYKVPSVEGSAEAKCVLTKHEYGRRFIKEEINSYMAFLFQAIVTLAPSAGFNVSLSRYDLFHGHMFTAHDTGRLGILFHCREYPAFDKAGFPINLGYCQTGSCVPYDRSINLRNIVWLAPLPSCHSHVCSGEVLAPGALFILDAAPDGLIFKELVSEWVDVVRTIYESDFGRTVIDVNYFDLPTKPTRDRIFLA